MTVEPDQEVLNETVFGFFSIIEFRYSPILKGGVSGGGAVAFVKTPTGDMNYYLKTGPDDRQWLQVTGG